MITWETFQEKTDGSCRDKRKSSLYKIIKAEIEWGRKIINIITKH